MSVIAMMPYAVEKTENGMTGQVEEIPLEELHEFRDHPFRVIDDERMEQMVKSVKENGIIVPGLARESPGGGYELISGHRSTIALPSFW